MPPVGSTNPMLTLSMAPSGDAGAGFFPDMLMVGGVLIITVCVFSMLRKKLKKHSRRPAIARANSDRRREVVTEEHAARQSIESVVVEAEALVRRLAAHLDAKSARLETLIRQADERLARLESHGAEPAPSPKSQRHDSSPHFESKIVDSISRDVYRLADEGLASIEIAQRLSEGVGKVELILALREN